MKKRIIMYVIVIFLLVSVTMIMLTDNGIIFKEDKNVHYMVQDALNLSPENNYQREQGYVSDAKTAARIGNAVIDSMLSSTLDVGTLSVGYDEETRMWYVSKSYIFHRGGFVIISQDTGEIVKMLLFK